MTVQFSKEVALINLLKFVSLGNNVFNSKPNGIAKEVCITQELVKSHLLSKAINSIDGSHSYRVYNIGKKQAQAIFGNISNLKPRALECSLTSSGDAVVFTHVVAIEKPSNKYNYIMIEEFLFSLDNIMLNDTSMRNFSLTSIHNFLSSYTVTLYSKLKYSVSNDITISNINKIKDELKYINSLLSSLNAIIKGL